ncbi:unnamed protein product, partial [Closterium sp. NIES-53]
PPSNSPPCPLCCPPLSPKPLQLASTSHHPSSLHPSPPLPSSIALPSWEGRKSQLAALSPLFPSPSPLL